MEDGSNKFDQLSSIFSQFSEENKETLLKTAAKMLKTQRVEKNLTRVHKIQINQ